MYNIISANEAREVVLRSEIISTDALLKKCDEMICRAAEKGMYKVIVFYEEISETAVLKVVNSLKEEGYQVCEMTCSDAFEINWSED